MRIDLKNLNMLQQNIKLYSALVVLFILVSPNEAYAMHIMEGFLPAKWCLFWAALTLPFIACGLISIKRLVEQDPKLKMLLALAGAFVFVLSSLKIPSLTGSCSHATGIGLGTILFGPATMSVLGCIVLIFQALLLAHGGITTLGANTFSMGVVGPLGAYMIYHLVNRIGGPRWLAVFLAASLGVLITYVTTAIQLALAFPTEVGGFVTSLYKFMGVFAITQIPLAIIEGILTVIIFNLLTTYNSSELAGLLRLKRGEHNEYSSK